ncbi:MAG: OB-fold domain-containing protein [Actinomycetota bacterium]|nr:OB-fold domain-containing protein [Actinomycetota bacterium]
MSERMPGFGGPALSRLVTPFYEAAGQGRLVIQQCDDCGFHRHVPTDICYNCLSWAWHWDDTLPGTGVVYSYSWVDRPINDVMNNGNPYDYAVVELDGTTGGPIRLLTNVFGVDKSTLVVGLSVKAAFDPVKGKYAGAGGGYGPAGADAEATDVGPIALVVFEPLEGAAA